MTINSNYFETSNLNGTVVALVKLYERNGQNEKAKAMAEKIINKKVKITSLKIIQIKKEMRLGLSPDVGECESENRHQTTE